MDTGVEIARAQCELLQQLSQPRAVLAAAATKAYLFAGVADSDDESGLIQVWSLRTFHLERHLYGHTRGVSCLVVPPLDDTVQQPVLLSAAADCTVRLWDAERLTCLCVLRPHLLVGNVFALACSADLSHVFLGCQNASIQFHALEVSRRLFQGSLPAKAWSDNIQTVMPAPEADPIERTASPYLMSASHTVVGRRVFGAGILSAAPGTRQSHIMAVEGAALEHASKQADAGSEQALPLASVEANMVLPYSHDGYIYCMTTTFVRLSDTDERTEVLISGSGDGSCKLWRWIQGADGAVKLQLVRVLSPPAEAQQFGVLCLLVHEGFLFGGLQGGLISVWDLETLECTHRLECSHDINALVACQGYVFAGAADGSLRMFGRNYETVQTLMPASDRSILSLTAMDDLLLVGSNGGTIDVWRVPPQGKPRLTTNQDDAFLAALEQFVSLQTVSGDETLRDECRRGAKFLKALSQQLGAEAKLVPGQAGKNPVVAAKFLANGPNPQPTAPTLLFYGHYDVQPANEKEWQSPPFHITGRDGYLYGRGVTDNKGPVLAFLFAVSELWREERLPANIVMLIEGEEESGSTGIAEALNSCTAWLTESGTVDCILISNTVWLNDNTPCVTYGLRGVVRATVEVSGPKTDLHSGVDGGVLVEPLMDLMRLLASLRDKDGHVAIPHFLDKLRPVTSDEEQQYDQLEFDTQKYSRKATKVETSQEDGAQPMAVNAADKEDEPISKTAILTARWNRPTLSVHSVRVSGPGTNTVIPSQATASVSMRIVPDQSVDFLTHQFKSFVASEFDKLQTRNVVRVDVTDTADWWLGDKDGPFFAAAKRAIRKVWDVEPLCIREGGTIPMTRFLEKWFQAPAVHLPMGQCSDGAHLANERIRLRNLLLGREVLQTFIAELTIAQRQKHAAASESVAKNNASAAANNMLSLLKRKRSSAKFTF